MAERETFAQAEHGIRLRRRWSARHVRAIGLTFACCVCVLWGLASYFRVSSLRDLRAYGGMAAECHPVWKDLVFRRIRPGDNIAVTLKAMPPDSREHLGGYSIYDYGGGFTSLRIYTKDDEIVAAGAGSCTWSYAFFDTLPAEDWAEINRLYAAVLDEWYREEYGDTHDHQATGVVGGGKQRYSSDPTAEAS